MLLKLHFKRNIYPIDRHNQCIFSQNQGTFFSIFKKKAGEALSPSLAWVEQFANINIEKVVLQLIPVKFRGQFNALYLRNCILMLFVSIYNYESVLMNSNLGHTHHILQCVWLMQWSKWSLISSWSDILIRSVKRVPNPSFYLNLICIVQ